MQNVLENSREMGAEEIQASATELGESVGLHWEDLTQDALDVRSLGTGMVHKWRVTRAV